MTENSPIETFFLGCETGDLGLIRKALKQEFVAQWPSHNPKYIAQGVHGLGVTAYNGHLNVVKYLLTSPEMKKNPEPNRELYTPEGQEPMILAFNNNHLEVVDFILEQIIKKYKDDNFYYAEYFDFSFKEKQNNLAKYLIGSTNLLENIHPSNVLEYACRTDNVNLFKYLLKSDELKENAKITEESLEAAFKKNSNKILDVILKAPKLADNPKTIFNLIELACKYNNLDILAQLTNSPTLSKHVDIDLVLCIYSSKEKSKNYNPTKYIRKLFSSPFEKHPNPNCFEGKPLINACVNGNYELVEFLTQDPSVNNHANPNNPEALKSSCSIGSWEIAQYLLNFSSIKDVPNSLKDAKGIFKAAYDAHNSIRKENFIKFLIFDLGIEKTPLIIECLEKKPDENISKMFKIRDALELEKILPQKIDSVKVKKSKI